MIVQFATPSYGYAPYYGQVYQPYYQPYYGGSGIVLGTGGLSFSFGSTPYYGGYRSYSPYYSSRYSGAGWYGSPRGYYGEGRGYGYRGGWNGGYLYR